MKKVTYIFLLILVSTIAHKIQAKGVIVYHNGETVNLQDKLPSECVIDGMHVNLGVMYDQFGLFWMPVWNYGTPKYVLVSDDEKTYWDLDKEMLESIKSEYNLSFPDEAAPSLWNKIGLKPVIIILTLFIIWSIIKSKSKDEDTDKDTEPSKEEQPTT